MTFICLHSSFSWGSRCEVFEDKQRVMHVKVDSQKNFQYCFGYLHGKDRSWMMDHFRRIALGRNAEVHGFDHLKSDMMMKLLDLPRWAEKIWNELDADERELLEVYSKGVNHGFRVAAQQPSFEFQQGYPLPSEWKPQDTLMVLLLQSFDQTRKTFFTEWLEDKASEKWAGKAQALYDSDDLPWDTTILKEGEYQKGEVKVVDSKFQNSQKNLWATFPQVFGENSGSNNWVVAPKKSIHKRAMLANDPHLDLKTPMFLYWIHIESPDIDVIGASVPGIPLIVSGANKNMSWGLTNSYINTADAVFLSKKDSNELERFWPVVWVKWGIFKLPIFFKSFQRTKEGFPILPLETSDSRPLLLKWSGFHLKSNDISSLREIMFSQSVNQMDTTLSRVGVPSWNFVFADKNGEIGYRVVGKIFKSEAKHPHGLRDGSLEEVRKPEFLNAHEVPHLKNPSRGWIATANNRHWPKDSKFYGGRAYTAGFRASRIDDLIERQNHNLESFKKLQCDDQAAEARYFVDIIYNSFEQSVLSVEEKAWFEKLKAWDYSASISCDVCPLYRRVMDRTLEELEVTEAGLWKLAQESSGEVRETIQQVFKEEFPRLKNKKWGDVHLNPFGHMSNRKDWKLSPELPSHGDKHSVNPGSSKWNEERAVYEHYSGASQRMIVDLKSTPEIWLTLPGFNNRYDERGALDPWQSWIDCEYQKVNWPMNWKGLAVEKVDISF